MLNISQKNKPSSYSLLTNQHLSLIKQNVLGSYFLVQQKKLKNSVEIHKKLKKERLKSILLKSLKPTNFQLLKIKTQCFRFKRPVKKLVKRVYKKLHPIFRKAFILKRFNKSRFRLPKNCSNLFKYRIAISIKKNNVFCTFSDNQDKNKTLISCNSGSYHIKVTKKTLRYTYDSVLKRFYNRIKKKYPLQKKVNKKKYKIIKRLKSSKVEAKKGLIATIVIPKRLRKKIVKSVRFNFKKIPLLIKAVDKKVFNGCRAPKSIRKKRRRRLRLYK